MAFGLLNSIIPQVGQPGTLYTGGSDKLTVGKVSIASKNSTPARIQLAYEDGSALRYFEYNKNIKYGQTYETQDIHLGAGQKLIVRSDQTDINFLFYGQTISDALHPIRSGVLSHVITTDKQKRSIFVAPTGSQVNATLSVCNMGVEASVATIGISDAGLENFDSTEYVEYNIRIEPGQTYTRTDIKIKEGQTIVGFSNRNSKISFVCHGQLFYAVSGLLDSDDKMILGHARIEGNLGIGITANGVKLHVVGDSIVTGNLQLGGTLTGTNDFTVKNQTTILGSSNVKIKDRNIELGYLMPTTVTGTISAGSDTVTSVSDTSNITEGSILTLSDPQNVTLTGPNDTIVTGVTQNSFTVSPPFSGTGTDVNILTFSGPNDDTADGGGITVLGNGTKSITWDKSTNKWDFSTGINVVSGSFGSGDQQDYKINDLSVLNEKQVLGCAITSIQAPTYNPTGIKTDSITTAKYTDDLITSRGGQVSLSGFFAAGF